MANIYPEDPTADDLARIERVHQLVDNIEDAICKEEVGIIGFALAEIVASYIAQMQWRQTERESVFQLWTEMTQQMIHAIDENVPTQTH